MKAFLEDSGLNLLGDTIAGFLGLATFVVVLITYFAQRTLAKQTIEEMKQQNRLSADIANANYQMALFDKRRKAFEHFIDARMRYIANSGKDLGVIEALENALSEAKFVYDQEMNRYLLGLSQSASTLHMMAVRHEARKKDFNFGALHASEQQQFEEEFEQFEKASQRMFKELFDQKIMEMFYKRLKLPEEIVVFDETATKQ